MTSSDFLTKLETIEPRPTEVIVFYFDIDHAPLEELPVMFEIAQREFPNNQIIFIPDKLNLELWDKSTLENHINNLNEILEKL